MTAIKTFHEYVEFTRTTAVYPDHMAIIYLAIGLANESGEVLGKLKKLIRGDKSVAATTEEMKAELGDVFWYIARLCDELKVDPFIIMNENASKLNSRKERNLLKGDGDNR